MFRSRVLTCALVSALGLAGVMTACSDDSSSKDTPLPTDQDAGVDSSKEDTGGAGGAGGMAGAAGAAGEQGDAQADVQEPDGDTGAGKLTCSGSGYAAADSTAVVLPEENGELIWSYGGFGGPTEPFEGLHIEVWESYGAKTAPGTYTLGSIEESYKTCGTCFLLYSGCTKASNQISCEKTYMPLQGGTYTIEKLDTALDGEFKVTLDNVTLQEVEIDYETFVTTPVSDGDHWCLEDVNAQSVIVPQGFVDIDPPDVSCGYPAPPYTFIGPVDGNAPPEPGTMPPVAYPGAYINGVEAPFDLAQWRCDHPEIKTLFIMAAAGWCSACASYYPSEVCDAGGIAEQLTALNAEILWVVGDANTPGKPATNNFANAKINQYGCDGGIRIADVDSATGTRPIWGSSMIAAIPWAAAIRMSDMKVTHVQSDAAYLDYIEIAEANNQ